MGFVNDGDMSGHEPLDATDEVGIYELWIGNDCSTRVM
jgi:hypothetical protein